jgi:hypothetical protein
VIVAAALGWMGCKKADKGIENAKMEQTTQDPAKQGKPAAGSVVGPPGSRRTKGGGKAMNVSSWDSLLQTVKTLSRLKKLSEENVGKTVGATLKQASDHPQWTIYEAKVPRGALASVEVRIKKDGREGLIILTVGKQADRVALAQAADGLGEPDRLDVVSPGLGSKPDWERKYSHSYKIEGQNVGLDFEDHMGRTELVSVAIEWRP